MRYSRTTRIHKGKLLLRDGSVTRASTLVLFVLTLVMALGLVAGGLLAPVAHAGVVPGGSDATPPKQEKSSLGNIEVAPTATVDAASKAKTPTTPVNMTPVSEQGLMGWERDALRDLAQVLRWPSTVVYDSSGRLKIQLI